MDIMSHYEYELNIMSYVETILKCMNSAVRVSIMSHYEWKWIVWVIMNVEMHIMSHYELHSNGAMQGISLVFQLWM